MGTAATHLNAPVIGKRRAGHPLRIGLVSYVRGGSASTLLSTPFVYSLIIPLALLDAWVTLYQSICFRAWGIARVRRRPFFVIDRHTLSYLNALEKLNCSFCSYANGVFAYAREVGARTEQVPGAPSNMHAGRNACIGVTNGSSRSEMMLRITRN